MKWTEHADDTLRMYLENMVAEARLAQKLGMDVSHADIVGATRESLLDLVKRSLPLARVMDLSDLVLHAEGPAVHDDSPRLSAFNWMATSAERAIRKLSGELFNLFERDARRLRKALDLRVTGMAPGSLYLGFAISPPSADLISSNDEPVFRQIRHAIRTLPALSDTIEDDQISPAAAELIPDAAERDAAFSALHRIAPTGQKGIFSLELSAPGSVNGELSPRERLVLHDALLHPSLANRASGTFTGEVREVDLDARRLHLRNVSGIGSLRCVLPILDSTQAKSLIGEFARVTGEYEADRSGRPRLLLVSHMEKLQKATQVELPSI